METIYESDYKKTTYDAGKSIIANYWTPATANMDEDEYQREIMVWVEAIEKYNARNLLAQTQEFAYTVSVEMQDWTDKEVFPRMVAAGVKKFAIVMSSEFIAQLSIEQVMQTESGTLIPTQYFDNEEDAMDWLKE